MLISRRGFFGGLAAAFAAPAIVRVTSIMPVRGIALSIEPCTNNRLIVFRKEIYREYIRANLFRPYIGEELTTIIRVINGAA